MSKRTTAPGGGLPDPDASGGGGDRVPFLKHTHLGKGKIGTKGTVLFSGEPGREVDGQYGKQIAFPVTVGRNRFDWGIALGSGNHYRLADRFGRKPPKGKVNVEIKENRGKLYVAIV